MLLDALIVLLALALSGVLLANLFPARTIALGLAVARRVSGLQRKQILVDDLQWAYLDNDRKERPTILLVHGFGADKDSWIPYARALGHRYRVIAPDLPGFGEHLLDDTLDYTPRAQAQRLAALCNALGLASVHVVGSSMGGYVSFWLALDAEELVTSLTLMNAAGVLGAHASPMQLEVEQGGNPLVVDTMPGLKRLLRSIVYRPMHLPRFVLRFLLSEYRRRGPLLDRIFWATFGAHLQDRLIERLATLKAPTLIVWGDRDAIIDVSCARAMHAAIPRNELLILSDVGHCPMLEAPKATASAQARLIAHAERERAKNSGL
ncbi:MAG: alpha/beta hydrolase [Pseudomonadota bacterium]